MKDFAPVVDVHTEQTVSAELRIWAKSRPGLQQDARRRLVLNDALIDQEIDELATIIGNR
jgi:hypothetical protein